MSATFEQTTGAEAHPAPENSYHWTFTTRGSPRVILNNPRGEIRVIGWDRPEVEIRAIKQLDNPARLRATRVEASQQDNAIIVHTITDPVTRLVEQGLLQGVAADILQALAVLVNLGVPAAVSLTVHLPRQAELEINAVSSQVEATGLNGTTRVRSVSGEVTLSDIGGYVDLNSVSGAQLGQNLAGRVTVNAVSGRVSLAGQIDDLRAKTVSGSVEYAGTLADHGHYLLNSVSGAVTLDLPAATRASFTAQGVSLGVDPDLPGLSAQRSRSPGNHQWSGQLNGGGARVHFQTVSGTLYLRELRRSISSPETAIQSTETAAAPPVPPVVPPAPSTPSEPPPAPQTPAASAPADSEQLQILSALERGEIGVDEAMERLEQIKRRSSGTAN